MAIDLIGFKEEWEKFRAWGLALEIKALER
jgi:hypothetical protein